MKNSKDEQLTSKVREINEAYLSVNDYEFTTPENCDILYANKFTQLEPVAMPKDLAAIFNNDGIKLNNPNLWEQIARTMNQYDAEHGPWYVSGDDSTLIIQNSSPGPDSGFVYMYQGEYGEVLKVRISKKEVYGARAMKAVQQVDYNRQQTQTVIQYDPLGFLPSGSSKKLDADTKLKAINSDNIPGQAGYSGGFLSRYELASKNQGIHESNVYRETWKEKLPEVEESILNSQLEAMNWNEKYSEGITANSIEARKNFANYIKTIDPLKVQQAYQALENLKNLPPEESYGARITWGQFLVMGRDALQENEDLRLDGGSWHHRHLIDTPGESSVIYFKPKTEQFATSLEASQGYQLSKSGFKGHGLTEFQYGVTLNIALDGKSELTDEQVVKAYNKATGQNMTAMDQNIQLLIKDLRYQQKKWTKQGYNVYGLTYKTENGRLQIRPSLRAVREQTVMTTLEAMQLIVDANKKPNYNSAFSSAMAAANNARNKLKRAKHKELQVELQVMGRPQLKSGIVITLLGIGQKYSGKWFVKSCIHQMDGTGYTCSLTLQKNAMTAPKGKTASTTTSKDASGNMETKGTSVKDILGVDMSHSDLILMQRELNRAERAKSDKERQTYLEGAAAILDNAQQGGESLSTFNREGITVYKDRWDKKKEEIRKARIEKIKAEKKEAEANKNAKNLNLIRKSIGK